MQHSRDYGPAGYQMGYRNYYRLNPGINGSTSVMCDNVQRTFTSNMSIAGSTYTWSRSASVLNYVSGAGTTSYTVEANSGRGDASVGLLIATPSGEEAVSNKDLYVGVPVIDSISGPTYTPNYQWAAYYAHPNNYLMGATDYFWALSPLYDNVVYDWGWTADIAFYSPGNYQFVVRAQNTCGWGDYTDTGIEVYDSKRLTIFPNPAGGEVTLTIEKSVEEELPVSGWDLEIYAPNMMLKAKKTGVKDNKTIINTSGWQEGIYMVRVKYDGRFLSGRLVVIH